VLEFFSTDTREPDETLLDLMTQIGLQLGRAIERQRADERAKRWTETLQQNEAELARRVEERTAELAKAQDELVRSERLSALGQVTATVAHELRNPLSAIKNTIYSIKERADRPTPTLTRQFERIERSILRCDVIIDALLEYSRSHQPKPLAHQFDRWLRETIAEHGGLTGIAIDFDLQAGPAMVSFDSDLLRRVMTKLIENAVQAFAENPENRAAPRLVVATNVVPGWLELCVEDNGPGIAPDNLAHVFEPLFSTKSFGTGLGLPIAKRTIEQHGGTIELSSIENSGTTVAIRLPVIAAKAAA
jgi:signal transduction histidine kinase